MYEGIFGDDDDILWMGRLVRLLIGSAGGLNQPRGFK